MRALGLSVKLLAFLCKVCYNNKMTVSYERSVDIFLEHEGEHFADALSPHTRRYTRQLAAELDELPGLAGTKSGLEELLDKSLYDPYIGRQLAKEALGTLLLFMRPFIADLPSDTALRHLHNNTKTPFAQTIVAVMMQLPKTAPVFSSRFRTCTDAEPMIMQAVRGAVMTVSAEKMQLSARACVLKDEDGKVVGLQKTDYEASVMPIATQPKKGLVCRCVFRAATATGANAFYGSLRRRGGPGVALWRVSSAPPQRQYF